MVVTYSPKTVEFVESLLREGASVADCKLALRRKYRHLEADVIARYVEIAQAQMSDVRPGRQASMLSKPSKWYQHFLAAGAVK